MRGHIPTERSFGCSIGGMSVAVSALAWWRGRPSLAVAMLVVGILLVAAGTLAPSALRVPNRVWWRLAQILGWINARVLLTVMFIVVLTPVGFVLRRLGRSPLQRRPGTTNWSPYPASHRGRDHYERLF